MDRTLNNFVGGKSVPSRDGRTMPVLDPSTGEILAHAPISAEVDVDRAVRAAAEAFEEWRYTTPGERSRALLRLADAVESRADQIAAVECANTGKPLQLTLDEEIAPSADQIRFFAGAARLLEGRAAGEYLADHTSYVRREPVGVCAQVTPWNYPLMMAVWKIAPALAAGNTVVLKPAETTPASSLLLAEIAAEFLPPGVLNVVCGDRDTGRAMVAHPGPAMASVTGSVRAGMEIARAAADSLKRVHLELGGKAPVIVFDDVDPAEVAPAIAGAAYFNAGQDCTAATRVLAGPGIADELANALAEAARVTVTGPPRQPGAPPGTSAGARAGSGADADADFGPLNSAGQLERVSGFVERRPEHARLLAGGTTDDRPGYFYPATVIAGLRQEDELVQQEVFGPVVTVQTFSSEDEAVTWANGVEYGLASSVWTADHSRAMRVTRRLDFGCVWVNTHIPIVAEMPHGGFKKSGYGKDLSVYGLEDYTRIKHVMHNFAFQGGRR
ncbi:gamma-aminobutyraldehyde dehydrogenase [Frankia sp. CcI49]|uniref:gamma-aminobutyraldehyde dehydrogenase n=1 Tax=Frankia sp. CcI49 TaxID=1745382 RepID=UPI0009773CC3|nr:gamma-aminobutyraldehyde dehydrogenase [Frankia sp. CcI49]ONH53554.1 gamma-aminobutyraldehyde dehydrogenase [Frankia sp. CcI49]